MTTATEITTRTRFNYRITAYWTNATPRKPAYGSTYHTGTARQVLAAYADLKRKVGSSDVAIEITRCSTGEQVSRAQLQSVVVGQECKNANRSR